MPGPLDLRWGLTLQVPTFDTPNVGPAGVRDDARFVPLSQVAEPPGGATHSPAAHGGTRLKALRGAVLFTVIADGRLGPGKASGAPPVPFPAIPGPVPTE